ncbi:Uma2 family endonuclease [Actinomadura nitritigenes]|uniref:Uma2 family endonuclease n=1 Tax=Actinomadura nitritigenes TaxID=134602 RepID=UPI003D8C8939
MTADNDVGAREREGVLLEHFLETDAPKGYRVELIDGEIFVTGVPVGSHEHCVSELVLQVCRRCARGFDPLPSLGVVLPGRDRDLDDHVRPDLVLVPPDGHYVYNDDPWSPSDGIAMVVEVTGFRPERDREAKRCAYARANIPHYLLVDREWRRVTLFSEPDGWDYGDAHQVSFGRRLPLPEPFGIELETAEFV